MFNQLWWIKRVKEQNSGQWLIEIEFEEKQTGAGTTLALPDAVGIQYPQGSGVTMLTAKPTTPEPSGDNDYRGQIFTFSGPMLIHPYYCKNLTTFERKG